MKDNGPLPLRPNSIAWHYQRDAVVGSQATPILGTVRDAIKDLNGPDRVVTATVVGLQRMHEDPLVHLMRSMQLAPGSEWLTTSPLQDSPQRCWVNRTPTHWPHNG